MAKRKKKRSLGDPPRDHEAQANTAYSQARNRANIATYELNEGNCTGALENILGANRANARAAAHGKAAQGNANALEPIAELDMTLGHLYSKFKAKCLK